MPTFNPSALRNRELGEFEAVVTVVYADGRRDAVSCGYRDTESLALTVAADNAAAMARRTRNQTAADEVWSELEESGAEVMVRTGLAVPAF